MNYQSSSPRPLLYAIAASLVAFACGATTCLYAQDSALPVSTEEIVHVLNRTSFGIRPGDVEMVQKMGLQAYIQQQLHPEMIDDSATDQAVAQLSTMHLSDADFCRLNQDYFTRRGQQLKLAAQIEARAAAAGITINTNVPVTGTAGVTKSVAPVNGAMATNTVVVASNSAPVNGAVSMEGAGMMNAAAPVNDTMSMESAGGGTNAATADLSHLTAAEAQAKVTALLNNDPGPLPANPLARNEELLRRANVFTPNLPAQQIQQAKLVRAVDSKRQLQEVLVDFWTNHFNVDTRKDDVRLFVVSYDQDTIRPHILGSFRDLLEATAKSPAMLVYLDNASNVVPNTIPKNPAQAAQLKRLGGLNENYGREIMELHTLGVDAGYTQKDVQEVARCFTGWTYDRKTGVFVFKPELHDNGPKIVLGHAIPANGGIQDGETVLDILTSSPKCAHFIAKEMCERFVSDDPAPALVNKIAGVFMATKGDLRKVTEAILTSREFLSPKSFDNKIKSPEEFAISAVRALGGSVSPELHPDLVAAIAAASSEPVASSPADKVKHVTHGGHRALRGAIAQMGEPLYNCSPPTGYKEVSSTWVNPGALIDRLNFAVALTGSNFGDVGFDAHKILGDIDLDAPDAVLDRCVSVLLQNKISDSTRKVLAKTAVPEPGIGKTINPSKLIALILGSPEFQRK